MNLNSSQIQLNTSRISHVPFQAYENDFTFIVNDIEYHTSKIVSDLLSPVISQMHASDATVDTFTFRTQNQGNFQYFLNLINFQQNTIPDAEIPFFVEVIQILGISINDIADLNQLVELNDDNIFDLTRRHEKWEVLYSDSFIRDIEYIASNFYKLCETNLNDLNSLLPSTLERIIANNNFKLKNENQLLNFINQVYRNQNDLNYSNLYHYVLYSNVDEEAITEFVDNFDFNDFDRETWSAIINRLKNPIIGLNEQQQNERYEQSIGKVFHPKYEDDFAGILNYLKAISYGGISNKVGISASSTNSSHLPANVVNYESTNFYHSLDQQNNWICFDFKGNKVIPSYYQIMSYSDVQNSHHPKSWVIQGSNDNSNWTVIDNQQNCSYLNGSYKTHIFKISNSNQYRFIRMQLTDVNWAGYHYFLMNSFELYGSLI